ncbi:tubulin-like doman-containing protein [Amycolatopsis speibonae]|uniref:Tubulin-like doman-containing protein n=1 Tax=Amycolatopsis speibonae TaxID=1450224 RepID=A0ABV7NP41_9PSEU
MLQKFLVVGVGGSGGVTLRMLRARLLEYLAERGYDGGLPAAWQLIHIDVPLEQDRRPERIPLLPPSDYVGLAVEGLTYRDVDEMLCANGDPVVRHTAGWRPDPDECNVAPESGGGRFRAVGRVILGARMASAHERLRTAVNALHSEQANEEFSEVCRRLTGNGVPSQNPTQVVVVTSLAGGSGSGLFLDVCDMLRQLEPSVQGRLVSVMYTPEVFDELSPADRAGINPNALATVCELLNGRWNGEASSPDEFSFLRAAGAAAVDRITTRGPRIPYLIGRTNGQVNYSDQGEVYEAVARGMTVWATSPEIQSRFSSYEIGNWASRANGPDRTGLTGDNTEIPLSSFGCASVGIGLDRFAGYSTDRLTREAVEHVLSGHWRVADEKVVNEEKARQDRVEVSVRSFLSNCGLDEQGPHRNDILDAIRGGLSSDKARDDVRAQIRPKLLDRVRAQWPSRADARLVAKRVTERMTEQWTTEFAACEARYFEATTGWIRDLQKVIQKHTADLLAAEGGPVAVDVLRQVKTELTEIVVKELVDELNSQKRMVSEMNSRVSAALSGTTTMPADHPKVAQAVDAAIDCFHNHTEVLVHELAIELIRDIGDNLLDPLRTALVGGLDSLQADRAGSSVQPSPVPGWPVEDAPVPGSYYPAGNELVLERVSSYPEEFTRLLRAQSNDENDGNAITRARSAVITGQDQSAVETTKRWVPRDVRLRQAQSPSSAKFKTGLALTALRERARDWIRRPDTPMARHLGQTLGTYLAEKGDRRQEHELRLENFRNLLAQAVKLSRPLIAIDAPALMRVHQRSLGYREVMTPLPFPNGHPGQDAARKVFASHSDADFGQLLGTRDTERIDIFTFLDAPVQPAVISSLTRPIAAQWQQEKSQPNMAGFWTWRRARGLPWFVPCPPAVRRNIVRGWFLARFLNQINCEGGDLRTVPTGVWTPDGYVKFPFPLLGKKIRKLNEWLPAVLESVALTVVGVADSAPYERLIQLGESLERQDELSDRGELARWLEDGLTGAGAPIPEPEVAGTRHDPPEDRVKFALQYVQKYQDHYDSFRDLPLNAASALGVSRAWEIREDIWSALATFHDAVVNGETIDPSDVG